MYMITHYDFNCCPLADGVARFFAEDIDEFEKQWIRLGVEESLLEKFRLSKAGACVTDWYSDDPAYNIVQKDPETAFGEKQVQLGSRQVILRNAYGWESPCRLNSLDIRFRWIRFKDWFYRIASFKAEDLEVKGFKGWNKPTCWGNPVLLVDGSHVESICYLLSEEFDNEEALKKDMNAFTVDDELLTRLLADLPGEAG